MQHTGRLLGGLRTHSVLPLGRVQAGQGPTPTSLTIRTDRKSFLVQCRTQAEAEVWVGDLLATTARVGPVPGFTPAPVWRAGSEEGAGACALCAVGFSFLNRRQHCRAW